tara:strand:- start:1123 stop:2151 length:1029 start_codon:yes stop_codon:yes gene_type:complete
MAIPKKPSAIKGIPVTDVSSAQDALLSLMGTQQEQPPAEEVQEEVEENTSEQAMENAESVETEAVEEPVTGEVTAEDLDDDAQEEETQETDTYTIKVDGKDVDVTLDELKKGYSRHADYTRKSQVLSEQRQRADQELVATQQERQRYLTQLEQIGKQADSEMEKYKKLDWNKIKDDDPMDYMAKRDAYRELQDNKKKLEEEEQNVLAKQQQEAGQRWHETLVQQQDVLKNKLPEWVNPETGPKLKSQIKAYALSSDIGFTEQEVSSLVDARSVMVLHKAMLYDKLKQTKIAKKKTRVVPKVTKPGTGVSKADVSSEKHAQLRRKAKSSGKVDDAAKYLESLL